MRRRWLVALALAAGCGSAGGHGAADGPIDAAPDHVAPDAPVDAGVRDGGDAAAANKADAGADARDGASVDAVDGSSKDVHTDAGDGGKDADAALSSCPTQIPSVAVGSAPIAGTLAGASRNSVVSCHGGAATFGPEAYFSLTLTEAMTVDFVVASSIDTLIAVRPGACKDAISEVACGDGAPIDTTGPDGGAPFWADNGGVPAHLSALRAPLAAGTYTIIVDSYALANGATANFKMGISRVQAAANAGCATPRLLTPGETASGENLDLASPPLTICGSGGTQSALFYTVGVPPGQRLTARATPTGGDRVWMPRLEAFSTCGANACLAQGRLAAGTVQQLDWINNGAAWQLVYLAVGSDGSVEGGTFNLAVTVAAVQATCSQPVIVKDGTMLLSQDLSLAAPVTAGQTCTGSTRALYYAASLLPKQTINVQVGQAVGSPFFSSPVVNLRDSCDAVQCNTSIGNGSFTNTADDSRTVLIEVAASQNGVTSAFDLSFSLPPPPPGIIVKPTADLVTTESGGKATFTIALASPPTADVTIALASDTPTEGMVSPSSVKFTSTNWQTPQTVTVTGVDDQVADGPRDYMIVTEPAVSDDGNYNLMDAEDVSVTNLDNDPGVAYTGANDVVTSEAGTTTTFGVSLNAAPTANVTFTLTSNDLGEGTVSPAQLTFTTANWNQPQTVTVKGVDDTTTDGTQSYTIVTGKITSSDARYAGIDPPDVPALNLDDDQVAVSAKVLSGNLTCNLGQNLFPIAVDRAGQEYIVMPCENQLWLTTSKDGGVTFSAPAALPLTNPTGAIVAVAAGAPGLLYLAFSASDGTLQVARSADAGATWGAPFTLSNRQDALHLTAGERTMFAVTFASDGSDSLVLTRSLNGGRSFSPKPLSDASDFDALIGADGQTAWLIQTQGNETLSKSTDAGGTFTTVGDLNVDVSSHAVGRTHFFAVPNPLQIFDLSNVSTPTSSVDFLNAPPFAMSVDDVDSLTVIDADFNGHLRATHVVLGAPTPTEGRSIGAAPNAAGVVTLSRKAAGVAVLNGGVVLYSTIVW